MTIPGATNHQDGHLPAILCLHGAGTNATIFSLQARTIIRCLKHKFRFIFVNAPFESLPGPGVIPTFAEIRPYLRWHCDEAAIKEFDVSPEVVDNERQLVRSMLSEQIEKEATGPSLGIVGVMAFSQGTRVATGLCLDPAFGSSIRFAILIAGTYPALRLQPSTSRISDPVPACNSIKHQHRHLQIASIHVQGTMDPWGPESARLLKECWSRELATIIKFHGAHQVPTSKKDAQAVAEAVLKCWITVET
ncbi:hypothetical protein KAF25_000227 [Fusarium avenaceum]|uniref:Serine hydrolase domain-containing protein n=1 Tax=Fusarium avenaceum TaxID=40199 RepID=A0A9P7GQT5_9HYPO|nr:hypothetical protein KAF25_000227 [Fusarium avenaceum]